MLVLVAASLLASAQAATFHLRSCSSTDAEEFHVASCAACYYYLKSLYPSYPANVTYPCFNGSAAVYWQDTLRPLRNIEELYNRIQWQDDWFQQKLEICCQNALECRDNMFNDENLGWCPTVWDGTLCWHSAPPNSTQLQPCAEFYNLEVPSECRGEMLSYKNCKANGQWEVRTQDSECLFTWTNATNIIRENILVLRGAYITSILLLIPAIAIFVLHRNLNSHRITLHKNLFGSLLIYATMEVVVISAVYLPSKNGKIQMHWGLCRSLLLFLKYSCMTSFFWMFCEGFYLHRLITAAFAAERSLLVYYLVGWLLPVVPISIYGVLRTLDSQSYCWLESDLSELVVYIPNLLALMVNMAFFADIYRILLSKLRVTNGHEPSYYRKAVHATLVLVPLFGLHILAVLYNPPEQSCPLTRVYKFISQLVVGLQGALVALHFCYFNREIHSVVIRSYRNTLTRYHPSLKPFSRVSDNSQTTSHSIL